MAIEKFIGIMMVCMFVAGFVLGWKAGRSFERFEKGEDDAEIH